MIIVSISQKLDKSRIIFTITLCISFLSFIPFVFPKLLLGLASNYPISYDEIYEFGKIGPFIIITNISLVLILLFFRYRKISIISQFMEYFSKYDVSRKKTFFILIIIFTVYILYSWDELFTDQEKILSDYFDVLKALDKVELFPNGSLNILYLRYILLKISHEIFGNIRLIPFLSSCILLLFTYIFTKELSKKRFAGIISVGILIQSNLFLLFDSIATYETFWITFYLISIYLVLKKTRMSFLVFVASLFTKAATFLFLPITLYLITKLKIPNKIKFQSIALYVIPFIILIFVGHYIHIIDFSNSIYFDSRHFWSSISAFSNGMRFDGLILAVFFPILLCLYFKSKTYDDYSKFLMFSLSVLLISPWILNVVLGFTNQPYRLIPFIVFFSIAFGSLFSFKSTYPKYI